MRLVIASSVQCWWPAQRPQPLAVGFLIRTMGKVAWQKALLQRLVGLLGVAGVAALLLYLRRRLFQPKLLAAPAPVPAKQTRMAPTGRHVAVTGANGYLGSACVELFLLRGHSVRGCVRGQPSAKCYTFLHDSAAVLGSSTFELAGGCTLGCAPSFERAFSGCDTVVHTAMPMDNSGLVFDSDEYRRLRAELIQATMGVLEAAAAAGVTTFVHTSSSTAVIGHVVDGRTYDETDWSDEQPGTSAYGHLKAAVERTVVEWHREHRAPFRLVRICPPAIIGPSAAATVNEFVKAIVTSPLTEPLKWSSIPQMRLALCTLRDAALAHALALENEAAHGRFCIGEQMLSAEEWLRALRSAGYCWPIYLTLHLPVPGPSWIVTPIFRSLLSLPLVARLLGFGPDEVRSIVTILGTSSWVYDCSRAKRELAPPGHEGFTHECAIAAGIEAARSLEARGMLSGPGGHTTPEGRAWKPSQWESKYCRR